MRTVPPCDLTGLSGGLFDTFGNISSITTPILIGAVLSYLVVVRDIKRVVLRPAAA